MEALATFYNIQHFHEREAVYTCCLYKKEIAARTEFCGPHLPDRSDDDVRGIALANCKFQAGFPRDLTEKFPNLDHLAVNGGLSEISKEDLAGYANLRFLDLQGCEITSLPDDLFVNTPNLEVVYFSHNHIASIGRNLLEPLKNLKYIDLRGNVHIDAVYDEDKSNEMSFDDLIVAIRERCAVQNNSFVGMKTNSLRVSGAK